MRASVVRRCDRPESLLASSIPNLQLDCFPVKLNRADFLNSCRGYQGIARVFANDIAIRKMLVPLLITAVTQKRSRAVTRWWLGTYEVYTDCRDVTLCIGVVGESQQKARLPNTEARYERCIVKRAQQIRVRKQRCGYKMSASRYLAVVARKTNITCGRRTPVYSFDIHPYAQE